jgi:predicted RNase H-like nuclease
MRSTTRALSDTAPSFAGVDGCRAGWLVVLAHPLARDAQEHQVTLCARFEDVLALLPTSVVSAVDIPIGLLTEQQPGGRDCDRCARRLLGRRASNVFTPPTRPLLDATHYTQVRGHGLSIQAFNILPKIREVDCVMTPALQQQVYEAHPELAFQSLAGHPLQDRKKTVAGREERLRVLDNIPSLLFHRIRPAFEHVLHTYKRADVAPDDILDAYVLVWTALRIWRAQAHCVPRNSPHDARGLRMEIWY